MWVRYVGKKPHAYGRRFNVDANWNGPDDVQEVENEKAARRLVNNHPELFEAADDPSTAPPAPERFDPPPPDDEDPILKVMHGKSQLKSARASVLRAWAREEMGLTLADTLSATEARAAIVQHAAALRAEGLPVPGLPPVE